MKKVLIFLFIFSFETLAEGGKEIDLQQSISIALDNNFSLKAMEKEVESENSKKWGAFSGFLPKVNLNASRILAEELRAIELPMIGKMEIDFTYDYTVQVQGAQPVFAWGRIFYGYLSQTESLSGKREEYRGKREDVIKETINAYYGVLLAKELLSLTESALKTAEEHLRIVEAKFKTGEAIDFEVLRARVEVANTKIQAIEAENAYGVSLIYFRKVIGVGAESNLFPKGGIEELKVYPPEEELNWFIENAIAKRPELSALRHYEKAIENGAKSVRGAFFPAFALSGNYQLETNQLSGKWIRSGSLLIGFQWNIFDGALTYNNWKALKAQKESLYFTKKEVEEFVKLEVKKAYMEVFSAIEKVNAGKETLNTAKRGLEIAEERYKAGLMTNVEVMDAQLAFKSARINYIKALYEYIVAKTSLYRALGLTEDLVKGGML